MFIATTFMRFVRLPLLAVLLGVVLGSCGVNNIPSYEENAKAKWSNALNPDELPN